MDVPWENKKKQQQAPQSKLECAEESCSNGDTNKPTKAKMHVGLNFEKFRSLRLQVRVYTVHSNSKQQKR
jgi:hypothetical protein